MLELQVMKTEFIPKLVATATACCAIYLVLRVSAHLLTVKTLASVGYFDTLVRGAWEGHMRLILCPDLFPL